MHSNIKSVTFFLTSVAFVFLSSGCGSGSHDSSWQKKEGLVWNTSYHITYNGRKELGDSVVAILDRVGKSLSVFDTTSLVSRVNSLESARIDDDFIRVYSMSKKSRKERSTPHYHLLFRLGDSEAATRLLPTRCISTPS